MCTVAGCDRPEASGGRYPDGLCAGHADEWCRRNPEPQPLTLAEIDEAEGAIRVARSQSLTIDTVHMIGIAAHNNGTFARALIMARSLAR